LATLTSSILGQVTFQALPGRNQIIFYICSGNNLHLVWHQKYKVNYQFVVISALTLFVYIAVLIKVKIFKRKESTLPTISSQINKSEAKNNKWASISIEKQSLMDLVSVAISLSFYGPLLVFI